MIEMIETTDEENLILQPYSFCHSLSPSPSVLFNPNYFVRKTKYIVDSKASVK
jgi:hypothetical protein